MLVVVHDRQGFLHAASLQGLLILVHCDDDDDKEICLNKKANPPSNTLSETVLPVFPGDKAEKIIW